jgi:4-hydroxy-tetrahydrodipicolinate synthase
MPHLPDGILVALVTIFDDTGEVDLGATADHASRLVAQGVRGVVVAGSTGEPLRLDARSRIALAEAVRQRVDVPVIVGTGHRQSSVALAVTAEVAGAGVADALLCLSCEDMAPLLYYRELAEVAGDVPVLAYHFPAMSAPGIPTEDLPGLPVVGVKDSSGSADRLGAVLSQGSVPLYVGNPNLVLAAGALGAKGAILAVANTVPEECVAAWEGDARAQLALMAEHIRTRDDFPASLKPVQAA